MIAPIHGRRPASGCSTSAERLHSCIIGDRYNSSARPRYGVTMSEHRATIEWAGGASAGDFLKLRYTREHRWTFDGGLVVEASSSPSVVPVPWSNPSGVDPEEAYVASISSCHMLTFLFVAAKAGFAVASYRDEAVGVMVKNDHGAAWISKVTLAPRILYAGDKQPSADELAKLHHAAHDGCFIANSVKTEIVVA
jgi:organic hydroperoxide reductase OsmC/OhrA